MEPVISFIICTYNRAHYLNDTLYSLFQDFSSDNSSFELLVIDNNSDDETPEVVRKYQKSINKDAKLIRYIKETTQGLSHARNRGIKEAIASHVVFLDDDIRATDSLISAWIAFFAEHPGAVAGGGKIHVQFDAPKPLWMSHFLLPLLGHHDFGSLLKIYPKNKYPFGGNMGFKKSIFDEVGYFDTDLGRKGTSLSAGEEKEIFSRIRKKGYDIFYLPGAHLYHRVNKKRLTQDYIKKQAVGLGQSMKIQLRQASVWQYFKNWGAEINKMIFTIFLGFFYLMTLQYSKAKFLFYFRLWILKGYLMESKHS